MMHCVHTANYLIAYKVLLTASHILPLGYVLEGIVMLYPYALTTFVNVLSFLDVCFVFFMITSVFSIIVLSAIVLHL